ncbi:MAG: response regulator [Fibrobacterota bacterium]
MVHGRILLVDDERDLLEILGEFLQDEGFEVATASDGVEALALLAQDPAFDLLLSDINMPHMKGFELIERAKQLYPALKSALITAYDINSYIDLAQRYNIGNIIAKTSPFNFKDFLVHVQSLVTGDIFGLEKHFTPRQIQGTLTITHSSQIESAIQTLFALYSQFPRAERVKTALRELVVNAVYYGAKNEDGARKDEWKLDVALAEDEYVFIQYMGDAERIGISIIDQKGKLKKADVLYWLERNISRDPISGLVKSLDDEHGRGLFISREFIDSLIINIAPGKRTEIIILNYLQQTYKGFKPLIINEL